MTNYTMNHCKTRIKARSVVTRDLLVSRTCSLWKFIIPNHNHECYVSWKWHVCNEQIIWI